MALYRIIAADKERTEAFAELITKPLRTVGDEVFYTDHRGNTWSISPWYFIRSRIIENPEIITKVTPWLFKIKPASGTPVPSPVPIPAHWLEICKKEEE